MIAYVIWILGVFVLCWLQLGGENFWFLKCILYYYVEWVGGGLVYDLG